MPEAFEDKYLDVLQNIESSIVEVYREHPEMTDWDALNAIQALIRFYQAQARKRSAIQPSLSPLAQATFEAVRGMCEWRLGRTHVEVIDGRATDLETTPKTLDEIVACLKRIRGSIEMWNKEGGRRGYLDFVSQFVG
jgi:hypothetical protein